MSMHLYNKSSFMNDFDAIATAIRRNRADGMPKYLQLRRTIAQLLEEGQWRPGQQLPAEEMLVGMSGLSLGTVQKALRMLVDDGLLVRKQGTGTFVAPVQAQMDAPFTHCRFMNEETGDLLPIYSKVLKRRKLSATGPWSPHFEGAEVLCIERLFSIANEFSIYTTLYLDADRFQTLVELPLSELDGVNFKSLLSRQFHQPLARFSERLSVRVLPDSVCSAIKVASGTAGGVIEIIAFDRSGAVLYLQELHIPPNERRLVLAP